MAVLSKDLFTVAKNETVARDVWEMVLEGPTGAVTAPGQFIDIRLESRFPPPPHLGVRPGGGEAHHPL